MIKSKIINFEWLCDHNHYTYDQFDKIKMDLIKKELSIAANEGYNTVFGLYLIDGFLHCAERPDVYQNELKELKTFADEISIKIIIVSGQGEELKGIPFDKIFFDYTFRMTYESNKDYFDKNISCDLTAEKFLFLGGMPTRPNRIGLLSQLYDKGLLSKSEWSFFAPITKDDKNWCRQHLSRYSDKQYNEFIRLAERSFDRKYQDVLPYYGGYETVGTKYVWYDIVKTDFIKSPTFVDPLVFSKTAFSIISEGPNFWSSDNYFGTEKSWRTFLYKHPFIFSGHPDQFRYLKKLGYKTFEEYMLIKDYAFIENELSRINAIVENVEYFLTVLDKNSNSIYRDVQHNYDLFFEYAGKQNKFLSELEKKYNTDPQEIKYFFNRTGYEHLIRKIEYGI